MLYTKKDYKVELLKLNASRIIFRAKAKHSMKFET